MTAQELMRDYTSMMRVQQATVLATDPFDLVLSPVAPVAAFPADGRCRGASATRGWRIGFTAPYNLSGQPAATVNYGFLPDGRAIGLRVSGRRFDDVGVLRAVHWFERRRSPEATPIWPIPPRHEQG